MLDPMAQDMGDEFSVVQTIFNSTRCYDVMQTSQKIIVFETIISFQLAFFALIEHDSEVAPLWDPERRNLVAMMTISDYIHALQVCRERGMPIEELGTKSISEMMASPAILFRHSDFQSIDAEDSVYQLYMILQRLGTEYVPVVDPDEGNIVSVLGYLDIMNLLGEAATQHPQLFAQTVDRVGNFTDVVTAPKYSKLVDVLKVIEERNLIGIPVTDESGQVVGMYHKNDSTFITRAADPQGIITNFVGLSVGEILSFVEQQQLSSELLSKVYLMVKCSFRDSLSSVIHAMTAARTTIAVCVNEAGACIGTLTVKDILRYYFQEPSGRK